MRDKELPKNIVLISFDGVQVLDIAGPSSVFSLVERDQPGSYNTIIASPDGGIVQTSSGIELANTVSIENLPAHMDTVLIAGGDEHSLRAAVDAGIAAWAKGIAGSVRRIGSVCTGAFVLAAAGLLDGRRATTHWYSAQRLQHMCPETVLDTEAVFIIDPPVYTSAGVTTGIDLALAMVEADFGNATAAKVARELVVFARRNGNQAQFSATLLAQERATGRVKALLAWMADNPEKDLSVRALAAEIGMSERNFQRVFKRETGRTPAWLVEQIRIERAIDLLERTQWPLAKIAKATGFGSVDTFQRAFYRKTGVSPKLYLQNHL